MAPAIGIDLGTKYSCVAVYRHGKVEIIANELDDRTTPSCVAFTDTGRLMGDAARNQADVNPRNTIFDIKRLIGRYFDDATVQSDMTYWPFDVVSSDGGKPKIQIVYKGENKTLYPEEVSAMVLARMKETAEAYLGTTVQDAVIAVPACFSNAQRQATMDAATIAGLNVRRIISEPAAAANAYGLDRNREGEHNVLIFDLGGGSFDVSILTIEHGVIDVKAIAGDTHLGGEDFDNRMVTQLVQEFHRKYGKDLSSDKRALRRLRTACERAKLELSAAKQASIEVHSLFEGIDFCTTFTRARFEKVNADLFDATMEHVQSCLRYAKLEKWEIDDIVLVGGSTRIPRVQELLRDFFDGKELNKTVNPDEAVAYGAALKAASLNKDISEELHNMLELDMLPLSIGVADGGLMTQLFERNTTLPTKQSYTFTTISYNQTGAYLHVFEGDSIVTKDNNLLGTFEVAGIPPAPPGKPQVEALFDIDSNGILTAWVVDKTTDERRQIPNKRCFTKEEIERLADEARRYRRGDDHRRMPANAKNALESYCFNIIEKCEETIKWLEANQQAGKQEFEDKHKELIHVCNNIIKLHSSSDFRTESQKRKAPTEAGPSKRKRNEENGTSQENFV